MSTAPVKISEEAQAVETRFRQLEAIWEADTMFLSDVHRIVEHPAFQEIIGMGKSVIPLMLRDLEKEPRQWVWALPRITGANPIPPEEAGNSRKMAEAWLRWGPGERLPMVEHIIAHFPKLADASFRVTSEPDHSYNCIAWAANVTHQRWWPADNAHDAYWPEGVPRSRTLAAFQVAFATLGYETCDSETLEPGLEKIAFFADPDGTPTHAARQLANGKWTSKLGKAEDIEHALHDVEGVLYGAVVVIMRRAIVPAD